MRDPKRIPDSLELLEEVWRKNPDLRFIQLINMIEDEMSKIINDKDTFYAEDVVVSEALKRILERSK